MLNWLSLVSSYDSDCRPVTVYLHDRQCTVSSATTKMAS